MREMFSGVGFLLLVAALALFLLPDGVIEGGATPIILPLFGAAICAWIANVASVGGGGASVSAKSEVHVQAAHAAPPPQPMIVVVDGRRASYKEERGAPSAPSATLYSEEQVMDIVRKAVAEASGGRREIERKDVKLLADQRPVIRRRSPLNLLLGGSRR